MRPLPTDEKTSCLQLANDNDMHHPAIYLHPSLRSHSRPFSSTPPRMLHRSIPLPLNHPIKPFLVHSIMIGRKKLPSSSFSIVNTLTSSGPYKDHQPPFKPVGQQLTFSTIVTKSRDVTLAVFSDRKKGVWDIDPQPAHKFPIINSWKYPLKVLCPICRPKK